MPPFEALLNDRPDRRLICFIVDLYEADGTIPEDLETAVARKSDLIFGNQSLRRLEALRREEECRFEIGRAIDALPPECRELPGIVALEKQARRGSTTVAYLSYQPLPDEAGPECGFDYSHRSLSQRWRAGEDDMQHALSSLEQDGIGHKAQFALRHIRRPEADGPSAMARREPYVTQAAE